jgi:hypothetical protein
VILPVLTLLLQTAPYQTGPAATAEAPAYRVGPAAGSTYTTTPSLGPAPPELARTGVTIDNYDRRVESRWGADDPFYTQTIRGGAAAAQSRQGEMDGSWTLSGAQGEMLYALELADAGYGLVEGAWRAASGGNAAPARSPSGFISLASREAGRVTLWFLEPQADAPTSVRLDRAADGSWRGELTRAPKAPVPVVLQRR